MDFLHTTKQIKKGDSAKAYLLYGQDETLKSKLISMLKDKIPDCQYMRFSVDEIKNANIKHDISTGSLFAQKKLIVVDCSKDINESDANLILNLCDALCHGGAQGATHKEEILLILTTDAQKPDPRFQTSFYPVDCSPLYAGDLEDYAIQSAESHGKVMQSDAANLLVQYSNQNINLVETEVQKLVLYVGAREMITKDDVYTVVESSQNYKVFDLVSSLIQGNLEKSLKILHDLLDKGERTQLIIGSLGWQLRKLIQAKELSHHMSLYDAFAKAAIAYKWRELSHVLDESSIESLEIALNEVSKVDLALKLQAIPDQILLDCLIVKLANVL